LVADDTYIVPEHGWTCFHCGQSFPANAPHLAAEHFGAKPDAIPGCMLRVQYGEEMAALRALRKAEAEIVELSAANEQLDHEAGAGRRMTAEIARRFKGARSVADAFNLFDSMEGRALAAEERLRQAGINPEAPDAA
jgi:hypothetical protein